MCPVDPVSDLPTRVLDTPGHLKQHFTHETSLEFLLLPVEPIDFFPFFLWTERDFLLPLTYLMILRI